MSSVDKIIPDTAKFTSLTSTAIKPLENAEASLANLIAMRDSIALPPRKDEFIKTEAPENTVDLAAKLTKYQAERDAPISKSVGGGIGVGVAFS